MAWELLSILLELFALDLSTMNSRNLVVRCSGQRKRCYPCPQAETKNLPAGSCRHVRMLRNASIMANQLRVVRQEEDN